MPKTMLSPAGKDVLSVVKVVSESGTSVAVPGACAPVTPLMASIFASALMPVPDTRALTL